MLISAVWWSKPAICIHMSPPSWASLSPLPSHPSRSSQHRAILKSPTNYLLWHNGTESTCQRRRHKRSRFVPWVRKIPWSRKWQPNPVFLPEKFHGQRSLVGYSPWGHKRVRHNWLTEHAATYIYVKPHLPVHPTLPTPPRVHASVLYVCISISAMEIGSFVPFSLILHTCVKYMVFVFLFLSHKREWNWVIWKDVGGPGACQNRVK